MPGRRTVVACLAFLFACTLGGLPMAVAQVGQIWTTVDGEKIRATEKGASPKEPVTLFGMRNETLSFQIVVPAGPQGVRGVLLRSEGLSVATVEFFREDYVTVSERSHGLVWKPGSLAEPDGFVGEIPDRLVPLSSAVPVDIPASRHQVFWVDLWISPDAPAGIVSGRIMVETESACDSRCTIAVEIELLDRRMPDEMHAKSMVWFSGSDLGDERVAARYFSDPGSATLEDKARLRLRHYQLARKHRLTLFGQHEDMDEELDALLSGRAFSAEMGYQGPGQGKGLDILVLHAYGGEVQKEQAEAMVAQQGMYPDLRDAFVYIMDEPGAADRGEINRRAHASKPLRSFATTLYTDKLDIDIFAVLAGMYSRSNAAKGRAAGKKIWIYNGERPFTGSFAIDDVAVAPRVNPWIQYMLDIPRWFYWEATYYYDFQGKRGAMDVARNALNFSNRHGDKVNGDGLLMYPGRDLLFPESSANIDGPMPSLRLKSWRRGVEDVEYLVMAREAGFHAEVDALLATLLPAVVDAVGTDDAVTFPEDGETWRRARRYLFELLRDGRSEIRFERVPEVRKPRASGARWPWGLAGFALLLVLAYFRVRHHRSKR